MATMSDHLWRRTIELFLVAGKANAGGNIPNTKEIAWYLRTNEEALLADLEAIASLGIISKTESGWVVNKFNIRQAASTSTERSRECRKKEKREQYYGESIRCGIYKIQCKKSARAYIGSSIDIDNRVRVHFYEGETFENHWMHADLLKYGKSSFNVEILEIVQNEKDLPERETFWIKSSNQNELYNSEFIGKNHRDRNATPENNSRNGNATESQPECNGSATNRCIDTDTETETETDPKHIRGGLEQEQEQEQDRPISLIDQPYIPLFQQIAGVFNEGDLPPTFKRIDTLKKAMKLNNIGGFDRILEAARNLANSLSPPGMKRYDWLLHGFAFEEHITEFLTSKNNGKPKPRKYASVPEDWRPEDAIAKNAQ